MKAKAEEGRGEGGQKGKKKKENSLPTSYAVMPGEGTEAALFPTGKHGPLF